MDAGLYKFLIGLLADISHSVEHWRPACVSASGPLAENVGLGCNPCCHTIRNFLLAAVHLTLCYQIQLMLNHLHWCGGIFNHM